MGTSNSNTNPQNSRKRDQNQSSGYESISATSSEYSPPNDKKQKILNYSHNAGNSHNHKIFMPQIKVKNLISTRKFSKNNAQKKKLKIFENYHQEKKLCKKLL